MGTTPGFRWNSTRGEEYGGERTGSQRARRRKRAGPFQKCDQLALVCLLLPVFFMIRSEASSSWPDDDRRSIEETASCHCLPPAYLTGTNRPGLRTERGYSEERANRYSVVRDGQAAARAPWDCTKTCPLTHCKVIRLHWVVVPPYRSPICARTRQTAQRR